MANELQAHGLGVGKTIYCVRVTGTGTYWNGTTHVAYNAANWATYAIAMTEIGAGSYMATMPTAIANLYSYLVFEQAGATPAVTDTFRGSGLISWNGMAEIAPPVLSLFGMNYDDLIEEIQGSDGDDLKILSGQIDALPTDIDVQAAAAAALLAYGVALENTLTAIKGNAWTTETLVAIDVLLDAIKVKTDIIVAGLPTTVIYPVAEDGTVLLEAGDDYQTAEGYQLDWLDSGEAWPILTAATIAFNIGTAFAKAGSVVVGSGTGKKVRVVLTAAETATLTQGQVYWYNVKATLTNGHVITLVKRSRLQIGKALA